MKRVGSQEIVEWGAEFKIRNDDEREAMERGRLEREAGGPDGGGVMDDDEIVRIARERGHIT